MTLPAIIGQQMEEEELIVTDMESLRAAFKARRNELGLSQLAVDEIAGIQPGYLAKLEVGMKNFWSDVDGLCDGRSWYRTRRQASDTASCEAGAHLVLVESQQLEHRADLIGSAND